MAETVYLNDGSTEVIIGDKRQFLERLIREKIGDDAAECFNRYAAELLEMIDIAEDCAAERERSADGYLQMCRDACNSLREILTFLTGKRLNRKALRMAAQNAYDDLYKNL